MNLFRKIKIKDLIHGSYTVSEAYGGNDSGTTY